ncbi:MAG: sulfatase [Bryobacteraceae bacterium]
MITRRRWLGGGLAALGTATGRAAPQRPNVLFIAIDDLNDWVGALAGHPQTVTPSIDGLARRGVTFRHAYCQAPMCNPSRASLMLGLRPSSTGIYRNADVWRDGAPDAVALPQHFMNNGYEVLGGGKIYHGSQNDARSWQAYYNFEGFLHPPKVPVNDIPNAGHFDWSPLDVKDEETADTKLAMWTGDYLSRKRDKPFFLACGFYRPHLPWYVPRQYFDKFPESGIRLPEVLANDLADVPKSAIRSLRDHDNVTSTRQWKKAVASYLACINFADANVGRVLRALDSGPNRENTIIVLWTDHGWQLGEKQQWRKFTLWERSCRVVCTIAAPGVSQSNRSCGRTVELLDIYPTLADLCNLPPKKELEGRSLRPLLQNPDASWDKPAITSDGPDKTTVRTERWRYSRFADGEELYDHTADPHEWHNLAGRAEHAGAKRQLAALLPSQPVRKKLRNWGQLSPDDKRLFRVPTQRHPMPDPQNDIGLKTTLK